LQRHRDGPIAAVQRVPLAAILHSARAAPGRRRRTINPPARIAVMDMIYDNDTIDKKVVASLKAKDYVRAGFDLLSTGSAGRDFKRVRAEYQNLVYSNRTALGSIVKT
jgi:hypothetical protein